MKSEKEKMLSGEPYQAFGEELLAEGHHLRHAGDARQRGGDDGRGDVVERVERRVAARDR